MPTSDSVRRRVLVQGLVQGVGFRAAVASRARAFRVAGWVRNLRDGSVEAVFEGPPDAVDALVRFAGEGPRGAHVARVEVTPEEPEGLAGFGVG